MNQLAPVAARRARSTIKAEGSTQRPMLLLFGSRTSGQSRRLDGFVSHVLQRRHNHDSMRYRIVEQEDRPDLFERFHVEQVPSLVVIDDDAVAARMTGLQQPKQVEDMLSPWLH